MYNKGNICYRLDIGDSIIDFIENDVKLLLKEFMPPSVKIVKNKIALWVPSAGIIDSHGVMQKLEYQLSKFA